MDINSIIDLLKEQGQIILQGAPGTGKTYATVELAVALCCPDDYQKNKNNHAELKKIYDKLVNDGRVAFTTFHQSMDYEDFVEGYKPATEEERGNGVGDFKRRDGIFKEICDKAKAKNRLKYDIYLRKIFSQIKNNILDEIKDAGTTGLVLEGMQTKFNFLLYGSDYQVKSINTKKYNKCSPNKAFKKKTIEDILVEGINDYKFEIDLARKNSNELKEQGTYGWVWALVKEIGSRYNNFINRVISNTLTESESKIINYENSVNNNDEESNKVTIVSSLPYLLIIDEINRANISKVMGELITLLEKGKREGNEDARSAKLPYSQKEFTVPDNLYIIGTMNTADRSLGSIDYAIRRRFAFVTLEAEEKHVENKYKDSFNKVKKLIADCRDDDFEVDEIMVGHSYFMPKSDEEWQRNIDYKIIPLLLEYFKDGVLIDKENKIFADRDKTKKDLLKDYLKLSESQQNVQENQEQQQGEQ